MNTLAWGILGTGAIAHAFAKGVAGSKTGKLIAVGSRGRETAEKFGKEFDVPHRHASYDALIADKDVQAIYIATPHPLHAEWAIKAAQAGKHLLVEKPLGINWAEAMAIIEAARVNDVFLMEAFMYRCHPQTHKIVELIREKAIGDVCVIQATFSFHWPKPFDPNTRITSNAMGGGGILDVGCYPVSISRLIAGAAKGKPFANPIEVKGCGRIGTTGVDEWAVGSMKFPGDIVAEVSTGVQVNQENVVRVFGTDGHLFVPDPWIPGRDGAATKMIVHKDGQPPSEIEIKPDRGLYSIEADTVAENIERRQAASPAMSWDDTLGNMRALDEWRKSIGQMYDSEKLGNIKPVPPRKIVVKPKHNMKYGRIPGIDKPVSRLCQGADFSGWQPPDFAVVADEAFERGINLFDTAHIYGPSDKYLGAWVRTRGVRDQVIILGKGAHTPFANPKDLSSQLLESLENFGTDHFDLYMMHRDNPDIPVGEFVDVLNEHLKAGRFHAFGGSNWSIARVEAANEYAKKKGLTGFAAVSNNFSLARMVDPVWAGCVQASDPASRAWFAKTQLAQIPWSSQARGFFTDRAAPENRDDAELVRCWYSDDNFKRKERAEDLARKYGVLPINIALAYVLCQPFPTFPLIGPRQLSELRTSLPGLDVELTPQELKWLNLEE